MTASPFTWTAMAAGHLDAVVAIADAIHPGLPERREVLDEKRRLCPAGCRVLIDGAGAIVGYALAHPHRLGEVPHLDRLLGALDPAADCLYLHDVAVMAPARGHGAAEALIAHLRDLARRMGLSRLACTSVYGTTRLWSRHGFVVEDTPALRSALEPYGDTARYMVAIV